MLHQLIASFGNVISTLIKLAAAVALLFFLWGLAIFIFKSGDAKSHEEGRNRMVWGIIALFVMLSIWGIVYFIQNSLGLNILHNGWDTMPNNGSISV